MGSRTFSLATVALLVCAAAGVAAAKPSIAILGLEVIDKSGTPSNEDVNFAKTLTEDLRSRAKVGGPYTLANGGDKELIDLKLLKGCDGEAINCMASIGGDLGADYLMYGSVTKKGTTYDVVIQILDVRAKKKEHVSPSNIATVTSGAALQSSAKKIYNGLTGQADGCTITVKTPGVERGTIQIGSADRGNITNSTGQISGLSEGKYTIAVESPGYHRWTKGEVACTAGENTTISADLSKDKENVKVPPPNTVTEPNLHTVTPPGEDHEITGSISHDKTNSWKYIAIGGGVLTAASATTLFVYRGKLADLGGSGFSYGSKCISSNAADNVNGFTPASPAACGDASGWSTMTYVATGATVVFGVLTLYSIVKAVSNGDDKEQLTATGHRTHHEPFAITPVVSPSGAGATFRMEW
jgi:TolB-like protein